MCNINAVQIPMISSLQMRQLTDPMTPTRFLSQPFTLSCHQPLGESPVSQAAVCLSSPLKVLRPGISGQLQRDRHLLRVNLMSKLLSQRHYPRTSPSSRDEHVCNVRELFVLFIASRYRCLQSANPQHPLPRIIVKFCFQNLMLEVDIFHEAIFVNDALKVCAKFRRRGVEVGPVRLKR